MRQPQQLLRRLPQQAVQTVVTIVCTLVTIVATRGWHSYEYDYHFDRFLIKLFRLMTNHINEGRQMLKVLGFVGMLVMVAIAMNMAAGLAAFIDINSIVIVFGGAALFALAVGGSAQSASSALDNLGTGAVYFGWLGFLIGVVAIAQNLDAISDEGGLNVIRLGEAASIGMLTVLYGYLTSWVVVPVIKSLTQDG